jgi:hypothetical protein
LCVPEDWDFALFGIDDDFAMWPHVFFRTVLGSFQDLSLIDWRMCTSMKLRVELPLFRKIPSYASIWLVSFFAAVSVFSIAILLQWLIYDDWMHDNGPVRVVGSALALVLTFLFTLRWQLAKRQQTIEMMRRFETIRWMNDRIRNSLQAIECLVFATHPHVTDPVRDAVDAIENVLQELLNETHPELGAERRGLIEPDRVEPAS